MKKENNFLDLMGEIDEKFVYEASLPWKKRNVNLKLKLAKIAAAGVVIALLIGGLGHPHEIKAAWEQITSWIQTALGINENVESYIDSVGKTITKNGISITLDEIAADKENLWVAISDNINDSKEKETILLTEVEINGKAAQLDGRYVIDNAVNHVIILFHAHFCIFYRIFLQFHKWKSSTVRWNICSGEKGERNRWSGLSL